MQTTSVFSTIELVDAAPIWSLKAHMPIPRTLKSPAHEHHRSQNDPSGETPVTREGPNVSKRNQNSLTKAPKTPRRGGLQQRSSS